MKGLQTQHPVDRSGRPPPESIVPCLVWQASGPQKRATRLFARDQLSKDDQQILGINLGARRYEHFLDRAVALRVKRGLHFHGFNGDQHIACLDVLPGRNGDRGNHTRHRSPDVSGVAVFRLAHGRQRRSHHARDPEP